MILVIDRFESGVAVLQDIDSKQYKNVPRRSLPEEAAEGDVILYTDGCYVLDETATKERRAQVRKRFDRLKE